MSEVPTPHLEVAAVVQRGDDLLLVRRGDGPAAGEWDVPGGALALGETMAEAVVRTFGGETGHADVLCGPFLGWSEVIDDDAPGRHRVVMYFTAVLMDTEPAGDPTAAEVDWVPVWTVPELRLRDGLAEFLAVQELIDTVV